MLAYTVLGSMSGNISTQLEEHLRVKRSQTLQPNPPKKYSYYERFATVYVDNGRGVKSGKKDTAAATSVAAAGRYIACGTRWFQLLPSAPSGMKSSWGRPCVRRCWFNLSPASHTSHCQ